MKKTFYSNGKLLISGEYAVLDGASALALPTKFGQQLTVENGDSAGIFWRSIDSDGTIWFEDLLAPDSILKNIKSENTIKNTLTQVLHESFLLNPDFPTNSMRLRITTNLTFPRLWGLGTSSTLIYNIAQWLEINPYELLKKTFGGSGYDIACAQSDTAIVYRLDHKNPVIIPVKFYPEFHRNLYFVYLNQKQSSILAIQDFRSKKNDMAAVIPKIDALTASLLNAVDVQTFAEILERHEELTSEIIKMPTVKQALFPDFAGTLKSLGAWGGDFILAVCEEDPTAYFAARGLATVIPFRDMVL